MPSLEKANQPSAYLAAKISALRRKQVATAALTGVAMAVGVGVELLALAMFMDWWLDLPWGARFVLLAAQLGVFTYIFLRFVAQPLLHQPDEDDLALMVEKARSAFRSRLIAAVQLTRPGAIPAGTSAAMVDAMVQDTEAMAAPMDFNAIVSTEKLKKLGAVAGTVTLLGVLGLVAGGAVSMDLLRRVFLSNTPVPRKTRISIVDGNKVVGRGDTVRLEAWAGGVIPSSGKLEVKYRGRRTLEYNLEQDRESRRRFGRSIENVQDSFTYTFFLNDSESPAYEVKTISRPTISTIQCDQEYPAYTHLKPVHRLLGDLSLLAGSRISLTATPTKPIQAAALKFVGASGSLRMPLIAGFPPLPVLRNVPVEMVPLKVTDTKGLELFGSFTVPAKALSGFSVALLDTEGMESRDSAVYRVDCIPDKAPSIRITYPDRKEELITRQAIMPVAFEASDDFAITKVRLRYKVDASGEGATHDSAIQPSTDSTIQRENTVELDLEEQSPQRLKRRHEWKIGAFNPLLSEGTRIEYWIEAQDNNDVTGPGVGTSEHQFARVVSESEKRADLLNRAGDYLGSISDVASDEQKLNDKLGTIIREKFDR